MIQVHMFWFFMTYQLILVYSGDAGGRPQQGIWLCVLLISRRSYKGCDGDERPNCRYQTLVRCIGPTQGGSQSTSGLPVYAANGQHAYAANGNCKLSERAYYLQPWDWLFCLSFFFLFIYLFIYEFPYYLQADNGIIQQLNHSCFFQKFFQFVDCVAISVT